VPSAGMWLMPSLLRTGSKPCLCRDRYPYRAAALTLESGQRIDEFRLAVSLYSREAHDLTRAR
jgi:hypothetical protein